MYFFEEKLKLFRNEDKSKVEKDNLAFVHKGLIVPWFLMHSVVKMVLTWY